MGLKMINQYSIFMDITLKKNIFLQIILNKDLSINKTGNYFRFYLRNIDIPYFEISLNANPVTGS